MLDDKNLISQRDPSDALGAVMGLPDQAKFEVELMNATETTEVSSVVLAGMGGSALAADMVKVLAAEQIRVPIEVIKGYDLPNFVDQQTLVVAISHSGNTEETLSCYDQAKQCGAALAAMATGGQLIERAKQDGTLYADVPGGAQPRMSTVYHLRILLSILQQFGVIDGQLLAELYDSSTWLKDKLAQWAPEVPLEDNYPKQIAKFSAGKTAVFYGGEKTWPLAYKWKISWNESAKNVAFWNQYPEFNHNEFMGWTSHPVEKPFAVFDLASSFERERIGERMNLSDRMLSGLRPKAWELELIGENLTRQFLWGLALADMASIYLAILNNVDPAPVVLIEKFKQELS